MHRFEPVPSQYLETFPAADEAHALGTIGYSHPSLRMIPTGPNYPEIGMKPRDWDISMHPDDAIAELKVDGVGAIWIDGRFWTLQGVPLECMIALTTDMRALEKEAGTPLVVQGEFTAGQFRETLAAIRRPVPPITGRFWMFDALPFHEWQKNEYPLPLEQRKFWLSAWADHCQLIGSAVLRHWKVEADQVKAHVAQTALAGLEGIVVKDAQSRFTRYPSSAWQRAKAVHTVDCEIVDINDKGLLVALGGREVQVKQGVPKTAITHFSVGDIVELAWNVEPGSDQPRHLRFVRARPDKRAGWPTPKAPA